MRWYFPSWHGDVRLETADGGAGTVVTAVAPTPAEAALLVRFLAEAHARGWTAAGTAPPGDKERVALAAPLAEAGALFNAMARPPGATLTAVAFADGRLVVTEGNADPATAAAVAQATAEAPAAPPPAKRGRKATPPAEPAAASVKRPTPSCPDCVVGAVAPATEALLRFLSPAQHADWRRARALEVVGGQSGHRYLLAHRATPRARAQRRVCWDLDDGCVVHFHDWTVPPEEEILAAKLILEHREPWLRNEATLWDANHATCVFKNPFGGMLDGVPDAELTSRLGRALRRVLA